MIEKIKLIIFILSAGAFVCITALFYIIEKRPEQESDSLIVENDSFFYLQPNCEISFAETISQANRWTVS